MVVCCTAVCGELPGRVPTGAASRAVSGTGAIATAAAGTGAHEPWRDTGGGAHADTSCRTATGACAGAGARSCNLCCVPSATSNWKLFDQLHLRDRCNWPRK